MHNQEKSFFKFIFLDKKNISFILVFFVAVVVQFLSFKYFYPYADFFSDSYSYIYAAQANLDISIWPIGYSKILRFFHYITSSDTALVAFQYFLLEISALYFFFTIRYFYSISNKANVILFIFLFFNPLFLYICNYVNSDALFAALSMFWITQLLWIIQRPQLHQIFIQALLLFACFTVRNNAYYYPVVTVIAFILSRQQLWRKLLGITLGMILIIPFIIYERNAAFNMIGAKQFSLFTGWQLANNALYIYGHLNVDSTAFTSIEARELNRISTQFYNKVPSNFNTYLSYYVANYFIRQPEAPLKQYFNTHYQSKNEYESIIDWGRASVIFNQFGSTLIKKEPIAFVRYFLLLNTKNYFLPPLEKLQVYNLGENEVSPIAQDWFDYKTQDVYAMSKDIQGNLLFFYPALFMLLNIYTIGGFFWFLLKKGSKTVNHTLSNTIWLIVSFLILNASFCIFATIIVLRYEVFPMIICFVLAIILSEWIDKHELENKTNRRNRKENNNKLQTV